MELKWQEMRKKAAENVAKVLSTPNSTYPIPTTEDEMKQALSFGIKHIHCLSSKELGELFFEAGEFIVCHVNTYGEHKSPLSMT